MQRSGNVQDVMVGKGSCVSDTSAIHGGRMSFVQEHTNDDGTWTALVENCSNISDTSAIHGGRFCTQGQASHFLTNP